MFPEPLHFPHESESVKSPDPIRRLHVPLSIASPGATIPHRTKAKTRIGKSQYYPPYKYSPLHGKEDMRFISQEFCSILNDSQTNLSIEMLILQVLLRLHTGAASFFVNIRICLFNFHSIMEYNLFYLIFFCIFNEILNNSLII